MSFRLFKSDILFYQRLLKSCGFYPYRLDGIWGPKTSKADLVFYEKSVEIKNNYGLFDHRSEEHILSLVPEAQILARQFLSMVKNAGAEVKIISGTRTYNEQNTLFRIGRWGNPGPRVTNARGGSSNHNFGLAWDIGIFEDGKYLRNDQPYKDLAKMVLEVLNLEWGGDWKSFKDYPHYQFDKLNLSTKEIRELFEKGQPYF